MFPRYAVFPQNPESVVWTVFVGSQDLFDKLFGTVLGLLSQKERLVSFGHQFSAAFALSFGGSVPLEFTKGIMLP